MEKKNIKTKRAVVIGKSSDKTVKVQIDYLMKHPKYGKYLRRRTRLSVHDPENLAATGDVVEIVECRPISKTKNWRLVNVIQKQLLNSKGTAVIQQETMLEIADNSGVKEAQCIRVLRKSSARLGKYTRVTASVGDIICVAIKKLLPSCQLDRKKVYKCVVVRTKFPIRRPDGSYVRFDSNAAVIIDAENNPVGTRVFGAVPRELRDKNFMKIISLASEVV